MLHLFNKVYLELDDKIELGYDRVVVSESNGLKMLEMLDKVANGELIAFGKNWSEALGEKRHMDFLIELKRRGDLTNKKTIIYCDKKAFKEIVAIWFRTLLPNLDAEGFKKLMDITIYKERIVTNTQLGSVSSLNMYQLWEGLDDLEDYWTGSEQFVNPQDQSNIRFLEFQVSYEYLLADYFSGSEEHLDNLLKTNHLFLKRFFQEVFTDNRQMCLLNITNYRFQEAMGVDPSTVDITKENPFDGIEVFKYYADDEIWDKKSTVASGVYGICNLDGISSDQVKGLTDTILSVYHQYEGMEIDRNVFTMLRFLALAAQESINKAQLDIVLNAVVDHPFDTCLVPRFDFENVNFPLILHFINLKKNNNIAELHKYSLF